MTEREVLRELVNGADMLGRDNEGNAWLLVHTTPHLLEILTALGAATADDEYDEDGAGQCEDEEDDDDMCVEDEIVQANLECPGRVALGPPHNEDDEREDCPSLLAPTFAEWQRAAQGGAVIQSFEMLARANSSCKTAKRYGKRHTAKDTKRAVAKTRKWLKVRPTTTGRGGSAS